MLSHLFTDKDFDHILHVSIKDCVPKEEKLITDNQIVIKKRKFVSSEISKDNQPNNVSKKSKNLSVPVDKNTQDQSLITTQEYNIIEILDSSIPNAESINFFIKIIFLY